MSLQLSLVDSWSRQVSEIVKFRDATTQKLQQMAFCYLRIAETCFKANGVQRESVDQYTAVA